jgi:hypothetical protein
MYFYDTIKLISSILGAYVPEYIKSVDEVRQLKKDFSIVTRDAVFLGHVRASHEYPLARYIYNYLEKLEYFINGNLTREELEKEREFTNSRVKDNINSYLRKLKKNRNFKKQLI